MSFLLSIFTLSTILCLLFLLAQWFGLYCLGIKVHKFQLFYGKSICSFSFLGTTYAVGWIPGGGSLTFDPDQFDRISRPRKILILLAGPFFLFTIAVIILHYELAFHHFFSSFSQFFTGVLHPRTIAVDLIKRLHLIYTSSFSTFVGVLAAKLSAFNLIPFGLTSGGRCIYEVFFRNRESQIVGAYIFFSSLLFFVATLI